MEELQMENMIDCRIKKYFQEDVLDFKKFPVDEIAIYYAPKRRNTAIDLSTISSIKLRQEIKDFLKLIFTGKATFTHTSRYMPELFFFLAYIKQLEISSIFDVSNDDMRERYLKHRNVIENDNPRRFINALYFHLTQAYDTRKGFERDIWTLDDFKLEEIRLNPTARIHNISFVFIKNEENKKLLKKYIKYLVGGSYYSLSTIVNILNICGNFSNFIGKSILETTPDDCEKYFYKVDKITTRSDVYNKHAAAIRNFIEYLIFHGIFLKANPARNIKRTNNYEYKETALSDFVIQQVFANLHKATPFFQTMYILNFCTGMRVSDLCQLKTDCLFTDNGHYFIKHYVQKMKKYQANIIPKSVFDKVMEQIKVIRKANSKKKGALYIFPSPKNKDLPCSTQYYSKHMKAYMERWGIKSDDGTPYQFKSHAYRHTIASDLLNNYNVDLSIIQLGVLGHTEINMSLCYAERRKERKQKYQTVYVDIAGNKNHLKELVLEEENEENMILPNGLCTNPSKLGICPHYEACLSCQFFRTSIDYLELHKQHYADLQKKSVIYEKNNLTINYLTTKKEMEGLKKIIDSLLKIQQKGEANDSTKDTCSTNSSIT